MSKTYTEIRKKLRRYRLLQKEIEHRTKYMEDFSKILVSPLPKTEDTLHRIYDEMLIDMKKKIEELQKKLTTIDKIMDKLEGNERSIIYYRYVLGINWVDLPEYMIYEQRSCQLFEINALKKIEKMDIDWEE